MATGSRTKRKKPAGQSRKRAQTRKRTARKPATRAKSRKPAARKPAARSARPGPPRPAARKGTAAAVPASAGSKGAASRGQAARPGEAAPSAGAAARTVKPQTSRKSSRRSALSQRRGPDGELLAPGELLLPGGPQTLEEVLYLLRGCVAAEHGSLEVGVAEVLAKRTTPGDPLAARPELNRQALAMDKRFASGTFEPMAPSRAQASRRTFASVVERARMRRREIGSFLRGLHIGRTETSHMDSHGEASLQSLMEWAARLENLMEAEEPDQADYSQFHRGLDHLENTTEALMVDVEATLRRLRDRVRG